MLTIQSLIFNKYTFFVALAAAGFFVFYTMSSKIENLEKSLEIESQNVVTLKTELKKTNDILLVQEKNLLDQVDNILMLETEKQNLKNDLQKQIEKRNKKDVNNIIVKKERLTETTVNRFIKKKIKKYNEKEGVK